MRSIFYVNSVGFMCQWNGEIVEKTSTSMVIMFSKRKKLKFDLRFCAFVLETEKKIENIGVCISGTKEAICFDDKLKDIVLEKTKGNVLSHWNGKGWE